MTTMQILSPMSVVGRDSATQSGALFNTPEGGATRVAGARAIYKYQLTVPAAAAPQHCGRAVGSQRGRSRRDEARNCKYTS